MRWHRLADFRERKPPSQPLTHDSQREQGRISIKFSIIIILAQRGLVHGTPIFNKSDENAAAIGPSAQRGRAPRVAGRRYSITNFMLGALEQPVAAPQEMAAGGRWQHALPWWEAPPPRMCARLPPQDATQPWMYSGMYSALHPLPRPIAVIHVAKGMNMAPAPQVDSVC
ncbi:hypothetical protein GGX14DRAFT_596057 [Mycena pura]|uniref:Uncharacterized protein n=1 Tax=Mycena pura TaxID=153505 RepID=A0AAD6UQH5_9AGAR|nr:hypothetical protein GGX14DRAFT_596057 [Mycena pura]